VPAAPIICGVVFSPTANRQLQYAPSIRLHVSSSHDRVDIPSGLRGRNFSKVAGAPTTPARKSSILFYPFWEGPAPPRWPFARIPQRNGKRAVSFITSSPMI
jgi:hypothetical protein